MMRNPNISKDKIREAVEYVFRPQPVTQERRMKLCRYCLSIGGLRLMSSSNDPFLNICHNEKCVNCRDMENIFQEELKKFINAIKKEDL